jgi:hypothetical protein
MTVYGVYRELCAIWAEFNSEYIENNFVLE